VETLSPDLPEAAALFSEVSDLYTLSDRPVYSHLSLARRLRNGLSEGEDILHSLGYYDGAAEGAQAAPEDGGTVKITVTLTPGPLYRIGGISFQQADAPVDPEGPDGDTPSPPEDGAAPAGAPAPVAGAPRSPGPEGGDAPPSLPPISLTGVREGDPAVAAAILDAVDGIAGGLADQGRPFAEVTSTRYWLDKEAKLLFMEVGVYPGEFVRMGPLRITGDSPVKPRFVENHVNWARGEPWNQSKVEAFRDSLFQTGLFQPTRIVTGGPSGPDGEREVVITLNPTPLRTASGSINYDSDFGPGFEFSWEHRNLTGWGDLFRVDLPVWKDLQQVGLQYTRPYFFSRRQILLANSTLLREEADTYRLKSLSASAGLERLLSRSLTGRLMAEVEAGRLDEFVTPAQEYYIWGFPLTLDWDWADSLLDPTRGHRLSLLAAPYTGRYFEDFRMLKTRADAYQYFPLTEDASLVLALRGTVGAIFGAGASELPASLRFFSGGGGSVRGFRYRSIGPRNSKGRPAGGDFLTEVSGEIRWKFSQSLGVVAFLDGGNLYDVFDISQLGDDLLWGGGLGFRYYSPMGPFRLDVAFPISTGKQEEDSRFQLYISLGQSF
jgi:translocation and assembly module TamA